MNQQIDRTPQPDDIHTVPVFEGEPEHECSPLCWCEPELFYVDDETGKRCWSHRRPE